MIKQKIIHEYEATMQRKLVTIDADTTATSLFSIHCTRKKKRTQPFISIWSIYRCTRNCKPTAKLSPKAGYASSPVHSSLGIHALRDFLYTVTPAAAAHGAAAALESVIESSRRAILPFLPSLSPFLFYSPVKRNGGSWNNGSNKFRFERAMRSLSLALPPHLLCPR